MAGPANQTARAAVLVAAVVLSGCLSPEGGSPLPAAIPVVAVDARPDHRRTVVEVRGARVTIEPIDGLCLTPEAIDTTGDTAFVAITDCVAEDGVAVDAGDGFSLPPTFPGLITVSVSAEPMFGGPESKAAALRALRDFLGSAPGLTLLGRNGDPATVEMVEARQIGDALYVHVRDTHDGGLALLSREFWRAFVEIEERLLIVTVSGFRDNPIEAQRSLAVLAAQVARLRSANGAQAFDAELALAEKADPGLLGTQARSDPSGGLGRLRREVAETRARPAPVPPSRPRRLTDAGVAAAPAGPGAPEAAPLAPVRPSRG